MFRLTQAPSTLAAPTSRRAVDVRLCSALSNKTATGLSDHHPAARPQLRTVQCSKDGDDAGTDRRVVLASVSALVGLATFSQPAQAGFKKELKRRKLTEEDFVLSDDVGLRVYELEAGNQGPAIQAGDRVLVHFDVLYKGVDVVSSRSARLLGGNRTIAEPYEYVVGEKVTGQPVKKISEGAGGLFAGSGGPKPPPALSTATVGMRKGGKRVILVDKPELGYGATGIQELPPNTNFELKVEVLDVFPKKA